MKKIILTTLMALSFQSMAQTAGLEMNKILEPSREEQEKRHYKELNDKMLKLKHNANAPLITEEQCFEQAYEELKRTPISPDTNNLNSPFKGYDNQIKGLTNFTNSQGRGMSCKDTTLLYIVDAVSAVKRINESNIEKEKKIEKMIKASDRANQVADEKFRKIEEEKEFNSNPKNFPYKETWYDYEKGIYEIKLTEITDQGQIQNIKNKYKDKLSKELCSDSFTNYEKSIEDMKEIYFYEYNFEEINGFFVNSEKVTDLVLNSPFMGQSFFKNENKKYSNYEKEPHSSDIYSYIYLNANSGKMKPLIYDANGTEVKVAIDSILKLNIHNYNKKLYLSINFNQNKVPYYLSLKYKQPELYELYNKSWFMNIIAFEGYNLEENILFLKRNCNNPPNLH